MNTFDTAFCPVIRSDLRTGRQYTNRKGRTLAIVQDMVFKGVSHPGYQMSPKIVQLFPYLDGKTELSKLPELIQAKLAIQMDLDAVQKVIAGLARYDLLDTPETRQKRVSLEASFRQTPVRPPCNPSGAFYPIDPSLLKEELQRCFLYAEEHNKKQVCSCSSFPRGFLLPHASINSSGNTAACALQSLIFAPLPDCYIIIGPNHIYPGPPCATTIIHPFHTPLGEIEVDQELTSLLEQFSEGHVVHDYISQYHDHSIEMILPFLQWIHSQSSTAPGKAVHIVPLLLTGERHRPGLSEPESHTRIWQLIGQAIARILSSSDKRIIVIVSGDFVHRGPLFHFIPFSGTEDEDFYAWDRPLLQAIERGDAENVLEVFQATNACVGRPIYTVLKSLAGCRWHMIDYHVTWAEENAVSFASFIATSEK